MLKRFKEFKGFKSIPGIYSGYTINIQGEIKYRTGDIKIPTRVDEHGDWLSLICTDGTVREFNRAVLVSMVARNIGWSVSVCSKLTMYFLDGNNTNVHPSNTIIAPLPKDVEWKSGWRYIPGFSRYVINEKGELWDLKQNKKLKWYVKYDGYLQRNLVIDVSSATNRVVRLLKQHRGIMLAFTNYPKNVCDLVINHINNISADNRLENLEWCTQSHNIQHAAISGNLFTRAVKTKCVIDGEEKYFNSITEAAKYYGGDDAGIFYRCKTDGLIVFKPATLFKFAESDTPWPDLDYAKEHLVTKNAYYTFIETNNTVIRYEDIISAAKAINLRPLTLNRRMKKYGVFHYNEFKIWKNISPN